MKKIKFLASYLGVIAIIIVLLNVISFRFFLRGDLTQDNRYSLSDATRNILRNMKEPVTVKAYFSKDLPPQLAKSRRDFKEMLVEYANLSKGKVQYEFIEPSEGDDREREAQQAGIPPQQIQTREKDKIQVINCYLGATVSMGDQQAEVLPVVAEGMPIEFMLSSAIKKLSVVNKPVVGFMQGHGEANISTMQQSMAQLAVLYQVEPVTMTDSTNSLEKYNTVIIAAPKDSFPASHLRQMDDFLAQGKNLLVMFDAVNGNFQTASGNIVKTGLTEWLRTKNIVVDNSFVIDANCMQVGVVQNMNGYQVQQQIPFPYLPIITNFNPKHPVSKGLEQVALQFASPIKYVGDSSVKTFELLKTSEKSGVEQAPIQFNVQRQWGAADLNKKNITVALSLQGKISGSTPSKMIVITDGDFAINGESQGARQLNPDNVNLFVNSVDWLSDDTGLIELRTKGVTSRPIEDLEDGTKTMLKYLNFLLPILLIVGYGIYRMQARKNQSYRRMQEGVID